MEPQDDKPENVPGEPFFRTNDVTILGIGNCGTNLVLSLNLELGKRNDVEFFVCHSNDYNPWSGDHIGAITWNDKTCVEDGHQLTPDEKIEKLDHHFEIVEQLVFGSNVLIISVGAGGVTGSRGAPRISEFFSPSWTKIVAFVVMPFAGEGERKINDAKVCLADLERFCNIIVVVSNQKLLEKWPTESLKKGFSRIDNLFGQMVDKIIEARKTEGIEFTLDDPDGLTSVYVNNNPE